MANKQLEAAAGIFAQLENYPKAIQYYEQIAQEALKSDTMKFSAKKWLFKAEVLYLVQGVSILVQDLCGLDLTISQDSVATERALQSHTSILPSYQQEGEFHLIRDLLTITDDPGASADDFGARLEQHNRVYRLDDLDVELFLRIRKRLEGEGEDFS